MGFLTTMDPSWRLSFGKIRIAGRSKSDDLILGVGCEETDLVSDSFISGGFPASFQSMQRSASG
jgi:hypothetical protein